MTQDTLFEPLKVGAVTVGHRLALAPLTRKRAANMVPNDMNITYYRQRGQYPGTLLITEGTLITKNAGYDPYVPGIWTKEQIDGWKKVADAVHEEKSFLFMQLWALGANFLQPPQESIDAGVDYVSASAYSALAKQSGVTPRALTTAEVKQYVKDYAQAAKNAIEGAGLDGVEIHGAHGYLPDQFLHENTNHRTDEYGGSIENRARFLLEIVDAVVEAVGADRVGIRLSPWATFGGVDPGVSPIPQWSYVITELEKRALAGNRLAYLHVVEPRVSGIVNVDAKNKWANDFVYDIWDGVVIKAGQLLDEAREIAAKYPKTLIAIGRYFISNPDLVKRVHDNLGFRKYDRDTFYEHGAEGYISYKNLGEEKI